MQSDLRLKIIQNHISKNGIQWQIAILFSVLICLKMVDLRLSFFEVFNSNFHILKVLSQLSLKIIMYYRKTLF